MNTYLPAIILLLLLTSCQSATSSEPAVEPNYLEGPYALDKAAAPHYHPQAISIDTAGRVLQGDSSISQHWQGYFQGKTLVELEQIADTTAGRDQQYRYEITAFQDVDARPYAQLIIWNQTAEQPVRELEFIAPYNEPVADLSPIDSARALWMQHCNAHRVDLLAEEVYAANNLYYNHKPLVRGRTALIEEYAYMNRPEYQLRLRPIHTEAVSQSLVFEIGQCSGSYGGRYVIIWQKQADGRWMVLLDSNV